MSVKTIIDNITTAYFLRQHGKALADLPWGILQEGAVKLFTLNDKNLTDPQKLLVKELVGKGLLVSRAEQGAFYYTMPRASDKASMLRGLIGKSRPARQVSM